MAANSVQFTAVARWPVAQVSTANTNRDGTGTIVDIITGVAAGTRINKITVKAVGTTTAGMVRIYLFDGTNTRLYYESAVSAITAGASTKTFTEIILFNDSDAPILPSSSAKIQASTHNAETFNIFVEGGDY